MEDIVKKISFNSNVRVSFLHVGYHGVRKYVTVRSKSLQLINLKQCHKMAGGKLSWFFKASVSTLNLMPLYSIQW